MCIHEHLAYVVSLTIELVHNAANSKEVSSQTAGTDMGTLLSVVVGNSRKLSPSAQDLLMNHLVQEGALLTSEWYLLVNTCPYPFAAQVT